MAPLQCRRGAIVIGAVITDITGTGCLLVLGVLRKGIIFKQSDTMQKGFRFRVETRFCYYTLF